MKLLLLFEFSLLRADFLPPLPLAVGLTQFYSIILKTGRMESCYSSTRDNASSKKPILSNTLLSLWLSAYSKAMKEWLDSSAGG